MKNVTEHFKRNGRAFLDVGKSAASIMDIGQILTRAKNGSDHETESKALAEIASKLKKFQKKPTNKGIQRNLVCFQNQRFELNEIICIIYR